MRVVFRKGQQKKFFLEVLKKINCPSLREIQNRGFDISYSTLKNYFSESRNLPEEFFNNLVKISGIDKEKFEFELVKENYGQVLGGKKSRR